ncbi:DDE_3 domain-containing protein [Trichonephila clavipes]|nr:DDE_3 domain-containing protein [Trichonephila clavipes]
MNDNARPHRALLVYEFLESKDIRRRDWPPDLNPIEHLGRSGDDNCYTQRPSENHPGNENSVAERVGRISTRTGKLPHFKNDITLRGLYSCKREPYSLLTHFFCLFCNRCFIPSNSNEFYARS